MTEQTFQDILAMHPAIGHNILSNIARQLAQRLRITSADLNLASQ